MAHDLFHVGVPLLEKVVRTIAVYGGLIALLRIAGRRDLAQLNSFDLIVLLLLSNVVQNAIIGDDNSLLGGLVGAAVLVGANNVVVRIAGRNQVIDHILEGASTVLVREGRIDDDAVRRLGLRRDIVELAVRRQGASKLDEVDQAVLSPSGAIVVTLRHDDEDATKGDLRRLEQKLDRLLAASRGQSTR